MRESAHIRVPGIPKLDLIFYPAALMQTRPRSGPWHDHARQWSRLASPLRPHGDDVSNVRHALQNAAGLHLLLGVTPEYAHLTDGVVAVDRNEAMISALWPHPGRNAIQGDWLHLPVRHEVCGAVIGDGALNAVRYYSEYVRLFDEVKRVLQPGGRLVLRAFVRPEMEEEACEAVCERTNKGNIGSFHAFKWRLAMAIASESGDTNVPLGRIHATFESLWPDRQQLAATTGWTPEQIATIDVYRGLRASYSFPTLSELRQAFASNFREVALAYGSYELSDRCPVITLEPCK